jgi:hypothetical protein
VAISGRGIMYGMTIKLLCYLFSFSVQTKPVQPQTALLFHQSQAHLMILILIQPGNYSTSI